METFIILPVYPSGGFWVEVLGGLGLEEKSEQSGPILAAGKNI